MKRREGPQSNWNASTSREVHKAMVRLIAMPYEDMKKDQTILRDKLAVERTKLAQERTYMAYIRTGMTLVLGGFFFIASFTEGVYSYVGYATTLIGAAFLLFGFYHHRKSMAILDRITLGIFRFRR